MESSLMRDGKVVAGVEEEVMEELNAKLQKAKLEAGKTVADEEETEDIKMELEPRTRVAFPSKLEDGMQLITVGLKRKKIVAIGLNIYAFGMYGDNGGMRGLLMANFAKAPEKPTKELYEAVISSDISMVVRLVIAFGGLSMGIVRKNFDEGLGASIKKLTGGQKNEELINKVLGAAKDSMKLPSGSTIEITRLPGYVLQTKVKGELLSSVASELLCRAYFNMYLGDDAIDKEAKERFGASLLSLF